MTALERWDINLLDFVLIKTIALKAVLTVTGDDDQAIYGFRGCTPDFIIDLEHHLGRPISSYELKINYRCPKVIVEHADRLIRHNQRRIPKSPIAANTSDASIKVVSSKTAGLEAKFIVALLKRLRTEASGCGFNNCAVLYRTNAQSLPLQVEFILNDIPYFVRPQDNIIDNEILAKLLGVLRLKTKLDRGDPPTPDDATAAIQAYFRYIDAPTASRLTTFFRQGSTFVEAIRSPQFIGIVPKSEQSNLVVSVQEFLAAPSLMDSLDVLSRRFKGLEGMIGSLEDALNNQVALGEIKEVAANFQGDTEEFVDSMQRAIDRARRTNAGRDEQNGVALLTYFKSKGLQWHTVILTTCNEGLIPHAKAPVDDERRLFYVAMTRASANLVVSYLDSAIGSQVIPSRFLSEAGLL